MIYFKIDNKFYTSNKIDILTKKYPLLKVKALYRILVKELNTTLKNYPSIDIIINFKYVNRVLGRYYRNRYNKGREYDFIGNKDKKCIVLFWHCINNYYDKHCIKGLLKVLYHEYGHYLQDLNYNKCWHNRKNIKCKSKNNNLERELILAKSYLNNVI